MKNRCFFNIAMLSTTIIALELTWTRIFSAEYFYTFAFLILSLAIMGLGLGALTLRMFPSLNNARNLGPLLTLTGLAALIGPPLVFALGLNLPGVLSSGLMALKFSVAILLLNSAYFLGGIALALIFKQNHKEMPRLYMADLIGAAGGVVLIILVMNLLGTPVASLCAALPVLVAAFIEGRRVWRIAPLLLIVGMVVLGINAGDLLTRNRQERAPVSYTHWDATAKIKVFDFSEDYRGINIDNAANSPVSRFDGNWDRPDSLRFQFQFDVNWFLERNLAEDSTCTFLSLGAGGGMDVLQALQSGATEVHAVEVVGHINKMMLEGELADFSGRIYHDPRVVVATEDARAYVQRHEDKFDFIYSLSSNSFAALASGSFALAENYLFTVEAFEDYWCALSDRGCMMMEHQFYMPRLISEVLTALERQGVPDPSRHIAVYGLPTLRRQMLLLSKRPLTDEERLHGFGDLTPENDQFIHLLYPAAEGREDNLINRIVLNGWEAEADSTRIDISPCTDDRPFTAQLGLLRNFARGELKQLNAFKEVTGFPLAKSIMILISLIIVFVITPLNFLPAMMPGLKIKAAPWLYFFVIGMAFMMVEVILIQKYTLFIGPSVYSIATILLTLLLACGIGSRFSDRISDRTAFLGILIMLALEIVVFRHLTGALAGLAMSMRILITMALVAPLGFFMGMPFPKGGLRVGENIDWGFAVNGAASVLGSTIVVMFAFMWGFNVALTLAAVCYAAAWLLFSRRTAW
ncbi:MAG: hypothetical protein GY835_01655 [bacterium]|nr:hypothetical protein [bacterium]